MIGNSVLKDLRGRTIMSVNNLKPDGRMQRMAGRIERFKAHNLSSSEFALKAILSDLNVMLKPPATETELLNVIAHPAIMQEIRKNIEAVRIMRAGSPKRA